MFARCPWSLCSIGNKYIKQPVTLSCRGVFVSRTRGGGGVSASPVHLFPKAHAEKIHFETFPDALSASAPTSLNEVDSHQRKNVPFCPLKCH